MSYLLGRVVGGASNGGVASSSSFSKATAMAWVRYFSRDGRKRAENVRKINPRVSPQEASSIARGLYDVVKQHGPLTISNAWLLAKDSGVSGLNSKTHMKLMLKWMRGRKMVKLLCNHVGSTKKFLLSTKTEAEPSNNKDKAEAEPSNNKLKLQTKKPSQKGKKQTR
ncbi:hypothetical protein L484_011827 [Morus notabilis]|uniref:Uncharacterized protein n=1 Tax=Morus notabilis TaxID=981085 RepID=W9SGY8_9ROSA|nr:uncharacterized protein LOC21395067 [Morus notabilis]EXC28323.1 hypothetical protein L484_011827 [Morus notabilis]